MASAYPTSDKGLQAWSANFLALITATPITYGLTAAQATAYGTVHVTYVAALAACDPNLRNKSAVVAKNQARFTLKHDANLLINTINGVVGVTNAQKTALGINVRGKPQPVPAPSTMPRLDIASVSAWTVSIRLHDAASGSKRGKPPGVSGASVFSFVGAVPPNDMGAWQFEGNLSRTKVDVVFPNTTAAGARVWLTAFWFNNRKQSGPACPPVSTNLQGGSVSMAA